MLTIDEARDLILSHCAALPAQTLPLTTAALGRVLAADVAADLDAPPFDKALMDGYAVRAAGAASSGTALAVVEEILAGGTPTKPLAASESARIMTGAPLPTGADAVVPLERATLDGGRVAFAGVTVRAGDNVLPRGAEMKAGETVLAAGAVIAPVTLGVLASVGKTAAEQFPAPRVALMSTGDELVESPAVPGEGRIRNSNAPMLLGLLTRAGAEPAYLGIARDTEDSLAAMIADGLNSSDVLVLTGGVSAGKADLVPGALEKAGVTVHFHHVHIKPGKPLLFGTVGDGATKKLVFGLPGNPVSALVCFEVFVRPALRKLAGHATLRLAETEAVLAEDFAYKSDRPTFHPARTTGGNTVKALPTLGSADLRSMLAADGLLVLPPLEKKFAAGDKVRVMRFEG